ncbi:MAG: PD-(D/E)XK nuclease family protein [Bacteroidota bacterium]
MPKYTVVPGELSGHQAIISRIKTTLGNHDFATIFIFPTLSLLKEIRQELLDDAALNGVGGVRLLLFEGFIEELVRRFGLEGRRPSAVEQELLITEAFFNLNQAGKLGYLNQAPFSPSYRRAMLEGIREWKRAGLTPEIFKEWARGQNAKEEQLALVYEAYQRLLLERGLVEEDLILNRLEQLRGAAGEMPETTPVVMYGFTDLTPLQTDYLKLLELWFDVEFIIDPTAAPELQKMVSRHFPVKFPKPTAVSCRDALTELQANFWTGKPARIELKPDDFSLQIIQAAGPTREITGIAREIVKLKATNPDFQGNDFLILTPGPQEFIKIAGPIFAQYGLEIGGGQTRSAREFPAVSAFYEGLTACDNDWQWPELELLIRHFYAASGPVGGDQLLLWIGKCYGAVSSRRRWLDLTGEQRFNQSATEAGFDLKPLKLMVEWLTKIPNQARLDDYLKLAGEWFETQLRFEPESLPADPSLLALEIDNYQAAQESMELLQEIGRMAKGLNCFQTPMTVREFQQFMSYYWEATAEVSGAKPQSIRVLPPREARGLRARVVFIAGLEQGTFPRVYVNDWKLAPAARRDLRTIGIELETGEQYQIQEALAFYWSLQTAKERLYMVYLDQDGGGQPLNRSMFLDEVLQWVPELEERIIRFSLAPQVYNSLADCLGEHERKAWLVTTLLLPEEQIGPEQLGEAQTLLNNAEYHGLALRLQERRNRGVKVNLSQNKAAYQLLNARFGPEHCFSITAIEDYRSCPYRFFLKHLLKVKPVSKPTLLPELLDLGNLYHGILSEFEKRFRGRSLRKDESEIYQETIAACLKEQYQEWRKWSGNETVDLILALHKEEILKTLSRWLESEIAWTEATAGRFQMQKFEWSFGIDDANPGSRGLTEPYHLEDGQVVIKIWGRIDRVDMDSEGNFCVYDYKLGKGPTAKDLLEMNNLQIPVYLLALEQLAFGTGHAVGGSYLGLREPSRDNGGIWRQEKIGPALKGKGLLDPTGWDAYLESVKSELVAAVSGIRSGRFNLTSDDCPEYCEYQSCCRRLEREVEADGASA